MQGETTDGIGCCNRADGWTTLLGGPSNENTGSGLLFTPGFPCGVEVTAAAVVLQPLRTLARWTGCIGVSKPGARAIITADVATGVRTVGVGAVSFVSPPDTCGPSAAPRVKLKWTPCGKGHAVIFDSDSPMVVPAGMCTIEILAPEPWAVMGRSSVAVTSTWTDVDLKVRACPCDCYAPSGYLTEWTPLDAVAETLRVLVRPRRARRLSVGCLTAAGAAQALSIGLREFAAGTTLGIVNWAAANNAIADDPFGGFPFLLIDPPGTARGFAALRWELR